GGRGPGVGVLPPAPGRSPRGPGHPAGAGPGLRRGGAGCGGGAAVARAGAGPRRPLPRRPAAAAGVGPAGGPRAPRPPPPPPPSPSLFGAARSAPPPHNDRFALRASVLAYRDAAGGEAVACYPRGWESVSFYLRREAHVYPAGEADRLIADLHRRRRTLLFV